MKYFTNQEIKDYYHHTQSHYDRFWDTKLYQGLHYGVWDPGIKSFEEAVVQTNKLLAQLGDIPKKAIVLDAGCGVGGSSFYLADLYDAQVTGISLSDRQVDRANQQSLDRGLKNQVAFKEMDYHETTFESSTFDICWAMESMQTSNDKLRFVQEMSRILKPGGKLLISDMFKPYDYEVDKQKDMSTYLNGWAMTDLCTKESFISACDQCNLKLVKQIDKTKEVAKTARRMYYQGLLGAVGTKMYTLLNNNVTHFSKTHYKTGISQYKGYKDGLWVYEMLIFQKQK